MMTKESHLPKLETFSDFLDVEFIKYAGIRGTILQLPKFENFTDFLNHYTEDVKKLDLKSLNYLVVEDSTLAEIKKYYRLQNDLETASFESEITEIKELIKENITKHRRRLNKAFSNVIFKAGGYRGFPVHYVDAKLYTEYLKLYNQAKSKLNPITSTVNEPEQEEPINIHPD